MAHYQYLSIARGGHSVLEALQQANVPVEEYIGFYSLRNWGKLKSPAAGPLSKEESSPPDSAAHRHGKQQRTKASASSMEDVLWSHHYDRTMDFPDGRMDYVTEQIYIHSKLMIVDDKTVICGSGKREIDGRTWTENDRTFF